MFHALAVGPIEYQVVIGNPRSGTHTHDATCSMMCDRAEIGGRHGCGRLKIAQGPPHVIKRHTCGRGVTIKIDGALARERLANLVRQRRHLHLRFGNSG